MDIEQTAFDYSALAVETQEFVKAKELAIKARTSQTIWENGRDLLEVKERLEHGQFQKWIETNFPWSERTARRMMQVAESFRTDTVADLDIQTKALYLLAAPSTPESAREEAVEKAKSGEGLTHQQAQDLIEAHKKISDQRTLIESLEDEIKDLEGQLPTEDVVNKISELSTQLEKEKNKPPVTETVEVEVPPGDYESIKENLKKEKTRSRKLIAEKEALLKRLITPEEIPTKKYKTIIIDPPWPMQKIQRDVRPNQDAFDYATMGVDEIADIPVERMADEDAHLYLWTTQKYVPDALRILRGWGFKYQCFFVWHKAGGFQPFNMPQFNCEFVLFGTKGNPKFLDMKTFFCCFNAARGRHSEKPDAFYETISRVSPGPKIDMFARKEREGWDVYGNEV